MQGTSWSWELPASPWASRNHRRVSANRHDQPPSARKGLRLWSARCLDYKVSLRLPASGSICASVLSMLRYRRGINSVSIDSVPFRLTDWPMRIFLCISTPLWHFESNFICHRSVCRRSWCMHLCFAHSVRKHHCCVTSIPT